MFKSVDYVGFDPQSELLTKAQDLMPVLDRELDSRVGELAVTWKRLSDQEVELRLYDDKLDAEASRVFEPEHVDDDPRSFPRLSWKLYLDLMQSYRRRRSAERKRHWQSDPEPSMDARVPELA